MASDIILYESDDVERPDILSIHGPPDLSAALAAAAATRYREKPLGLFPKKRIVLRRLQNVSVSGVEPILKEDSNAVASGSAAILVQKWGYGFYHFVNEMLPKILRIHERDPSIPIVTFYTDFIKALLDYAGVKNPIIPYDGSTLKFKDALHVSETASGNPTPDDIRLIRKHFRIPDTGKRDTNILIYRKESKRGLSNFFELKAALKAAFPGRWIIFDSMPLEATVSTFSRAKLIVAAHGAGLSNMIFAPKGTPIIEISPADSFNACFWHLSWILENPHHFVAASSSGPPEHQMAVHVASVVVLAASL
jgi:capsular polysaccharide biosynthesis protein